MPTNLLAKASQRTYRLAGRDPGDERPGAPPPSFVDGSAALLGGLGHHGYAALLGGSAPAPMPQRPSPTLARPAPTAPPAGLPSSVGALVEFAHRHQLTTPDLIQLESGLTAGIVALSALLKHSPITVADVREVERQARSSGKHIPAGIDALIARLPMPNNQARLRAALEAERTSMAKQLVALHVVAHSRGFDLAALVGSGKMGKRAAP